MEERYIDLHTHSVKSDGAMTPAEVVREAKKHGLSAIALSDHDSIDGVAEAMDEGKKIGIEVVPAIELSAECDTELHILGYYIDINNKKLLDTLAYAREVREQRQIETCKKLNELGFDVTMDEVRELAGTPVLCRAHFAKILTEKGYVESPKEAFLKYLDYGCYAYSNKQALTGEEAVQLIGQSGGMAFVAHLHLIKLPDEPLREFIKSLIPYGLDGIEGYYTDYTQEMQDKYQAIAKEFGLIISGGTDFHGEMKPHISIGTGLGNLKIPYSVLDGIKSELERSI